MLIKLYYEDFKESDMAFVIDCILEHDNGNIKLDLSECYNMTDEQEDKLLTLITELK